MPVLVLTGADLEALLPVDATAEAVLRAFAAHSAGTAPQPERTAVTVRGGTLLSMPGHLEGRALGAKLVCVFPDNASRGLPATSGLMVLVDPATGLPAALLDGTFLTAWRTGAAACAATRLLARQDARVGAVLGSGAQARTQLIALDTARQLTSLRVASRDRSRVERLVAELRPRLRADLVACSSPAEALRDADVVSTATSSELPVLRGVDLRPGMHVNAIGSFRLSMRELDEEAVGRAGVFVDSRAAALAEAGELVAAWRAGRTSPERWVELGRVAAGAAPGRRAPEQITLFKSVGLVVQDLEVAAVALAAARREGRGREVAL